MRTRENVGSSFLDRATVAASGLVLVFFAVLSLLFALGYLPKEILLSYLLMSMISVVLYAVDKRAARLGRWRIAEAKLHLLALLGGWPGAMWAQNRFRHKTQKRQFRWVYYIMVTLNFIALGILLSPVGVSIRQALQQVITIIKL